MSSQGIPLNRFFGLDFTQAQVDFVIPNLKQDLRLAIDPFLLFKSRDEELNDAHAQLLSAFNEAIARFSSGDPEGASDIIRFPEVNEIGFGYTAKGIHGSGLGTYLNQLVLETLGASPALLKRGVRHVEEMQLLSLGIGPDRVSDIAANLLKKYLIRFTQAQAKLWKIPVEHAVPVQHVFDMTSFGWDDGYYDLPVNRLTNPPRAVILVPRRIVRTLPWINFDDYQRLEFASFLRAKRVRRASEANAVKSEIVAISRHELAYVDHYVDMKEQTSSQAQPVNLIQPGKALDEEIRTLSASLASLPAGLTHAQAYQDLMLRIFNLLFEPDLIEGQSQVRTEAGTEIRDLVYTNDSDKPFLDFLRNHHANLSLIVELKNKNAVDSDDVNQLAGYLGDAMGYCGLLVTRKPWSDAIRAKAIAWYNKGTPHRVIVCLSDSEIIRMLDMKSLGRDPVPVIRQAYRQFAAKVQ